MANWSNRGEIDVGIGGGLTDLLRSLSCAKIVVKKGRPLPTYPNGEICKICGKTQLSIYNPFSICNLCKNRLLDRSVAEKEAWDISLIYERYSRPSTRGSPKP